MKKCISNVLLEILKWILILSILYTFLVDTLEFTFALSGHHSPLEWTNSHTTLNTFLKSIPALVVFCTFARPIFKMLLNGLLYRFLNFFISIFLITVAVYAEIINSGKSEKWMQIGAALALIIFGFYLIADGNSSASRRPNNLKLAETIEHATEQADKAAKETIRAAFDLLIKFFSPISRLIGWVLDKFK